MEEQSIITLTPEALASIITEAVARGVEAALAQPKTKSANAERCARYRQKKTEESTQDSMSKPCQSMSRHGHDMQTTCKPSLSPPSPTPPTSSHPPVLEPAPARKGAKAQSSNQLAKQEAEQANAEPIPLMLQDPDFHDAWERWKNWRTRCATIGMPGGKRPPWTPHAAQRSLRLCEKMGVKRAIAAIDYSLDRYQDIYEPNENSQHSGNHKTARTPASSGNGKGTGSLNSPGRYDD